ncbi:hypothetical protein FOC4_g10007717 [Fusarium odoratissimum]|uniref:Uncharacterized protein n=2 Tax=Fusarium oxysporum species complex TaxID=171631 RepID=N1RIT8_FUSC4|nr:hypothetical protein FOC4_g10007717 [Fusarium odoratissimum]TXC00082.1 hypothetical protein FocTR4_00014597 [Fusarium oxysporum f. sp. cubense]
MYGVGQNKNTSIFENSIKWHHVLSGWKNSMRGLKKFVMGRNDWSYEFLTTKAILQQDEHRTFACPEPESFGERPCKPYRHDPEEPKDFRLDKYLPGVGLV